jgi:hypothetical protein
VDIARLYGVHPLSQIYSLCVYRSMGVNVTYGLHVYVYIQEVVHGTTCMSSRTICDVGVYVSVLIPLCRVWILDTF